MNFKKFKLGTIFKLMTTMVLTVATITTWSIQVYAMKKNESKIHRLNNFSSIWKKICITEPISLPNDTLSEETKIKKLISSETPQENLVSSKDSIESTPITSWNNYNINYDTSSFNIRNIFDISHGIVRFVTYYSDNKFNTAELKFFCSGIDKYRDTNMSKNKNCDVLNILPIDYEDFNNYFTLSAGKEPIVGYLFNNVSIKPIGYSIRCPGAKHGSPFSFIFFGIDKDGKKQVLDERRNINDLIPTGGYAFFFCKATDQQFEGFGLEFTEPSQKGFWIFDLSWFEIHGIPFLKKHDSLSPGLYENQLNLEELNSLDSITDSNLPFDFSSIDPCIDMSEYLF